MDASISFHFGPTGWTYGRDIGITFVRMCNGNFKVIDMSNIMITGNICLTRWKFEK